MDRSQKEELVGALRKTFEAANVVVVTTHVGMTVGEVTSLRRKMRDAGAGFRVTKNRLARIALQGTRYEGLAAMFTGPTGIAFSADPVAAAKVAVTYANTNAKLKIVGGAMGKELLDPVGIKALSALPSLDELRARLVGMLQTPATRIAVVLKAPAEQLARVLSAYASKGEAA